MNKIKLIISILSLAFFMSACGGGGDEASFENSETLIPISVCETYTDIVTGDTVVQDENNTTIQTLFNTDGSKKVCVKTGSAHIIRQ